MSERALRLLDLAAALDALRRRATTSTASADLDQLAATARRLARLRTH